MKFGVHLLLVVALLLPIRGAMAVGGLLCSGSVHHGADAVAMAGHAHDAQPSMHAHHHAPASVEPIVSTLPSDDSAACNLCSAVCSAPPLPSPGLAVHALLPMGAERFPATAPSRSSVALDGPERPPRTV